MWSDNWLQPVYEAAHELTAQSMLMVFHAACYTTLVLRPTSNDGPLALGAMTAGSCSGSCSQGCRPRGWGSSGRWLCRWGTHWRLTRPIVACSCCSSCPTWCGSQGMLKAIEMGRCGGWELQSEQAPAWLLQPSQVQVLGQLAQLMEGVLFQLLLELLGPGTEADWTEWAQAWALPSLVWRQEAELEQG